MHGYRPEIDGLRTFAILPVILYHLKITFGSTQFFAGGFLGVDVFFVISGFLITKLLLDELTTSNEINIWRFYVRRARRILPALILVIIASSVAGYLILLPSELERYTMSALAALGFFSNIFWYFELGDYGAQPGLLQPLLHSWSLAIEEQFYLVFPLLLWLLRPPANWQRSFWILIGLLLLSLSLSELSTALNREMSFFSPISRAWELLAGSVLALWLQKQPSLPYSNGIIGLWIPKLALTLMVLSMVAIDLPAVAHPGLVTVPTVLATAALIAYARPTEAVTCLLSSRPMVLIGKWSYSLYLWHFPIFAYGRLYTFGTPDTFDKVLWIVLTFVCAIAGFYVVEQPFRHRIGSRLFAVTLSASCVAVLIFAVLGSQDMLKSQRNADLAALYGVNEFDNRALQDATWRWLDRIAGGTGRITNDYAHTPSPHETTALWFDDPEKTAVMIVGNSHSKDMFNALYANESAFPGLAFARFGMDARFPDQDKARLFASPNFERSDVVMISARYGRGPYDRLRGFVEEIRAHGKDVVIVGSTAEFLSAGNLPIFDLFLRRNAGSAPIEEVNGIAYRSQAPHIAEINRDLRKLAEELDIPFLSRVELICPPGNGRCTLVTPDGRKTMYDAQHWTLEGAAYFGRLAAETGWLDPITER
ncbi:MAG: acyltransferase family protein [Pseudomonadota bacterium]